MGAPLEFSRRAELDLQAIHDYIARDNPEAGSRWIDYLEEQCELLAEQPGIGVLSPESGPGIRRWPVGDYLVTYREERNRVRIIRVIHGKRDIRRIQRIYGG